MSTYAIIALVVIALAAQGWHAIAEHHAHLRLLRVIRPETDVPPVRQAAFWHALGHWKRMAVQAGMLAAALVTGFIWSLSAVALIMILATGLTVAAVLLIVRSAAVPGRRHDVTTELPDSEREAA